VKKKHLNVQHVNPVDLQPQLVIVQMDNMMTENLLYVKIVHSDVTLVKPHQTSVKSVKQTESKNQTVFVLKDSTKLINNQNVRHVTENVRNVLNTQIVEITQMENVHLIEFKDQNHYAHAH